ncbi:MAG: SH3 domain-containing protein [Anaerolineaceae bacterium]|nr:SH3 domain-containing protein [Anaerolineaceae bacterium]
MTSKKAAILSVILVWVLVSLACGLPTSAEPTATEKAPLVQPDPGADEPTATAQASPQADSEPSPEADPVEPTAPSGAKVNYQGVSFTYDLSLAQSVSAKIVPAERGEPGYGGWIGPAPEYYQFDFERYQLVDTFHRPQVLIYPIQEFAAVNEMAGDQLDELENYLNQPGATHKYLPFLPMWNAGQVFYARPTIVNFMNGEGVLYLTCFAQAILPVDGDCLFYTYQGLTYDKQYYVSAIFQVDHAGLLSAENTNLYKEAENSMDASAYETYLSTVREQLNNWPAEEFTPSLSKLEVLVNSLSVQPTVDLKAPEMSAAVDCPLAMDGRLEVGKGARVTFTDGKSLRVRSEAGKSATVLGQMPEGTEMTVNDGPVCVGEGLWWKITSADGKLSGWVLEGEDGDYYLEPWE